MDAGWCGRLRRSSDPNKNFYGHGPQARRKYAGNPLSMVVMRGGGESISATLGIRSASAMFLRGFVSRSLDASRIQEECVLHQQIAVRLTSNRERRTSPVSGKSAYIASRTSASNGKLRSWKRVRSTVSPARRYLTAMPNRRLRPLMSSRRNAGN